MAQVTGTTSQWSLTNTFTFTGNDANTMAVADIATVAVKPVLRRLDSRLGIRARATSDTPTQLIGMGTARFRIVKRLVHGTDYDPVNGIQRQQKGMLTTDVPIDQTITFATPFEDFDVMRFEASDVIGREAIISAWVTSLAENFVDNEELLMIRAHQDFCLATYPQNPSSVLVLDFEAIAQGAADAAVQAFYTIHNQRVIPILRMINPVAVGVDDKRIFGVLGMTAWSRLSQAYTKFIGTEISAETLANGDLYRASILGTEFEQNMFLEQDMASGDSEMRMNKDVDFMFGKLQGLVMFKGMWAFANGMIKNQFVQNYNNLNLELVTKAMFSMPEPLYTWAGFIIWPTAPTFDEITSAQNRLYDGMSTNFAKSFQLPKWVKSDFSVDVIATNTGIVTPNNAVVQINLKELVKTPFSVPFQTDGTGDMFAELIATPEIQALITTNGWVEADVKDWLLNRLHLVSYGSDNYASTAVVGPALPPTSTLAQLATASSGTANSGGWVDSGYQYLQAYIDPRAYITGSNTAHPVAGTTGVTISADKMTKVLLYYTV